MRTMVDLASHHTPLRIINTTTSIDCSKDVGMRRSFRHLLDCIIPACCAFDPETSSHSSSSSSSPRSSLSSLSSSSSTLSGTFFGYRRGRVSFCLHYTSSPHSPLLLLDFTVPTAYLAKEMQHGVLRIALESERSRSAAPVPLFWVPVWSMYCNGRKVGYAVRRAMREGDLKVFKVMQSVSVGAGVIPASSNSSDGEMMYLRASFEQVVGSADSESFHMINPVGSSGQQLSVFFLRT